jgi:hypothetical protein
MSRAANLTFRVLGVLEQAVVSKGLRAKEILDSVREAATASYLPYLREALDKNGK